ncbi:MAG: type II secretion system F family protein [Candidatus Yanofskybacteria bacterium]|nr:type II secretion system F family protein [Candidatus Yanofskybacteria bacterium]
MQFSYQIKTTTGEIAAGTLDAPDENVAVNLLHSRGYTVLSLEAVKKDLFSSDLNQLFSKPNTKDMVVFTRQLATLIDADMPLAEGLRTLAKQITKPTMQRIITEVSDAVEGGSSLSNALAEYPKLFTPFYIKLVKSGEVSGKLQDSLNYLADYLERTQSINSKIRGALAYPAFIIVAMVIVAIIMVVYVLPQLLVIFKESNIQDLPLTTKILIAVTDFVNKYIWFLLILFVGSIIFVWRYILTAKGKIKLDYVKLHAPIFGRILKNLYIARLAESLSTLIKSGISILDAIKITAELVGNRNYQDALLDAEESVRGGGNISDSFSKSSDIPPLVTSMVAIGERTGKLDYMLNHVSKFYRSESENDIQNISQLIEPVLVFVLGIGVAILVSSILLPIYNLVGAV